MDPKLVRRTSRIVMFGILCVVCVVMLFPFVLMTITSLRSRDQYISGSGFSLDSRGLVPLGGSEVLLH